MLGAMNPKPLLLLNHFTIPVMDRALLMIRRRFRLRGKAERPALAKKYRPWPSRAQAAKGVRPACNREGTEHGLYPVGTLGRRMAGHVRVVEADPMKLDVKAVRSRPA